MDSMSAAFQQGGAMSSTQNTAVTASSILSGYTQAQGALIEKQHADIQAQSLEAQGAIEDLAAKRERRIGEQRASSIRGELMENLASQRAAAGASGLASSSGSVLTGQAESADRAATQISRVRANADNRAEQRRFRGFQRRQAAKTTRRAGKLKRNLGLLESFSGVAERGFLSGDNTNSGVPSYDPSAPS